MRWLLGFLFAFAQGAGAESLIGKDFRVADGDAITILTADRQTRRMRIAAASPVATVPATAPKPLSPSVTKTMQAASTSSLTAPTSIAVAEAPAPARGAEPRGPRPVAAGLGNLRVLSALGQRFRAEIDIVSLRRGEQDGLRVRLASAEAFRQAGIEINPALIGVNMTIELRDGKPVVAVATRGSVNEPFLEMLVELEWASGRFLRKYAILLDPPIYIPPPSDAAVGSTTSSATPSAEPRPMTSGADYAVVKGDTLAKIALERMPAGATLDQMMVALYRANPDAFDRDNINLLPAGSTLKIPDRDAVAEIDRHEAKALVLSHRVSFGEYRRTIAATAPAAPMSGAAAVRENERLASERALAEAQSRVAELEKRVADLKQRIEASNQRLAELEKRAAEAPPVAPVVKPADEAPKPAPAQPKPAAKPKPAANPRPAAAPPPPAPEPSLVDEYLEDPLMLGGLGAVGLFLVGYGAFAWRKKMRARREIDVRLLGAVSLDLDVGNGRNKLR